jgi:hypothetical protein
VDTELCPAEVLVETGHHIYGRIDLAGGRHTTSLKGARQRGPGCGWLPGPAGGWTPSGSSPRGRSLLTGRSSRVRVVAIRQPGDPAREW